MNSNIETIEITIPKDRLNDYRYIQLQLYEVKCNILLSVSKKTGKTMKELIQEHLPEMTPAYYETIYKKYNIPIEADNTEEL
jgi:mitochondrial fission protein ELM1